MPRYQTIDKNVGMKNKTIDVRKIVSFEESHHDIQHYVGSSEAILKRLPHEIDLKVQPSPL
jgi:hypothetical protein